MRTLLALGATLATLAMPATLPSSARASEPQRSGIIVGGVGETQASPWVRGMEGCVGAATCSAWLQSGCDPALAGVDPALHAAVVDVEDLADNSERNLALRAEVAPTFYGHYTIQFWTNSDNPLGGYWCGEILDLRFESGDCVNSSTRAECLLRIPPRAKWMTITSGAQYAKSSWSLT